MKKICLISFLVFISTLCYSKRIHFRDVYTQIDSLIVESVPVPFSTEEDDYLIELPKEGKILLAYNKDKTKAIVLHAPGYLFIKHMEYEVKEDDIRLILWYKDKHIYCGFIYDKKVKAAKYFEAVNQDEKERLIKRVPFLKHIPTFKNDN